ncbi:MAG: hypothetical protein QNL00_09665, partial [Saprospiraceae bacterium]
KEFTRKLTLIRTGSRKIDGRVVTTQQKNLPNDYHLSLQSQPSTLYFSTPPFMGACINKPF